MNGKHIHDRTSPLHFTAESTAADKRTDQIHIDYLTEFRSAHFKETVLGLNCRIVHKHINSAVFPHDFFLHLTDLIFIRYIRFDKHASFSDLCGSIFSHIIPVNQDHIGSLRRKTFTTCLSDPHCTACHNNGFIFKLHHQASESFLTILTDRILSASQNKKKS